MAFMPFSNVAVNPSPKFEVLMQSYTVYGTGMHGLEGEIPESDGNSLFAGEVPASVISFY